MAREASSEIFVPHRVLQILDQWSDAHSAVDPKRKPGSIDAHSTPFVQRVQMAAVFIADISGFSKLEKDFEDFEGVDRFSSLLNSTLGDVEAIVSSMDGSVLHLAGDAVICVFFGDERGTDEHDSMEAAEEAARQTIGAFKTVFRKLEPRVAIHGAVAWGSLDAVHLDLRFEGEGKVGENNLKTRRVHY